MLTLAGNMIKNSSNYSAVEFAQDLSISSIFEPTHSGKWVFNPEKNRDDRW